MCRKHKDLPSSCPSLVYMPRSPTPTRPSYQTDTICRCCLPALPKSRLTKNLSRLNSAACTLPVYASPCQLPDTAQHSVLDGGQPCPDGIFTHGDGRVNFKCFSHYSNPTDLTRHPIRHTMPFFPHIQYTTFHSKVKFLHFNLNSPQKSDRN